MKRIIPLLFFFLIYVKTYSQSGALQEEVSYINKIIAEYWKGKGIQKFDADKYGNLVFYSTTGSYWFNLKNVIGFDRDECFLFPSTCKIRCSPDSCGERIVLIGNKVYSTWGKSSFGFLPENWRWVVMGGFSRLQEITKDPFKFEH